MALDPKLLAQVDDEHLLRVAHLEIDPLTSTPLELELLRRLERKTDEAEPAMVYADKAEDFGYDRNETNSIEAFEGALQFAADFDPATYRPLLDLLGEHDIDTPEALKKRLELATEFEGIANDAADAIARLSTLMQTTQE